MATTSPTTAAAPDVMGEAEAAAVHFTPLDYTVFVLLLVASLVIGIVSAFKNRYNESTQQYLVGDRKMSPVAVGLSLLGGWVSAVSILGNATEVYFYGTQLVTSLLGCIPAAILVGKVILPLLYELRIISINEYIELRYGSAALRKLMTLCVLLMNYFYMGVCLYAPSLALTTVTSLPSWAATLIMGSVCTFYITIGGVKAVVYTDVMQTLLMFGGVLAVVITCCQDLGGFGNVWTIAQRGGRISFFDMNTSIFERHTFLSTFVLGFYIFLNTVGLNSTMFQRFASVSTVQTAVRLNVFFLFGMAGLWIIFFLSGLVAYASYADCDPLTAGLIQKPDQIIPFLVTDRLSRFSGLVGIFVAAVYSGVLSTISSCANSVACVFWEDFLKPHPYFRAFSDAKATNVVKLISAVSGVVAILLGLLVEEMGNIFVVAYSVCGAVIGPMTGVYLSGMCTPWVNTVGATIGFFASLIFNLWIVIGKLVRGGGSPSTLPLSTAGCVVPLTNASLHDVPPTTSYVTTLLNTTTTAAANETLDGAAVYDISYCYIGIAGVVITMVVSTLTSLLTGPTRPDSLRKGVVSPTCLKAYTWVWSRLHEHQDDDKRKEVRHLSV
ncbi:sodium-coupled monocarboxylate transporter 1-like [Portunus trituberculatus]|uniref:sodium-coupled monocarboxylate transporter 1-like n=1 Tax=Portunus trituberculatus TaxID=210409 RepID=UPI001E1CCB1A|nr:sodium-coupled monocarboxylate transporter 1-like [Portunus trituberculatus]XP_045132788.1 sodium-coupled monocarboxylate transporter 1-like [Portunus trituberculatus]